ncbi:DUF6602 domain-containing protein [Terriglobus saanensis]|uniref:DUF6602 domain-containing protein n=1 Tax=Terriglobus saanensis (strain ATCC BAA-1853 / DSM 23119 / SP1PR4) TaxID=401053 RepID=E8V4D6_TERSS|nr:DUF6602 domain-containing protein [Terriglobus saanensis]ADV83685.1 hypothetical protein AciPR4_2925 [Terriglobus saanensis SP1PR4]
MKWNLADLMAGLHAEVEHRLGTSRRTLGHPGALGDASEGVWREMLADYLPKRYSIAKATVIDSLGAASDQIDIVIFDRQYTPFIYNFQGGFVVPAESVYAVFESKQAVNAQHVDYAQKKVEGVRALHRTSLPVPHVGGMADPKPLHHILGGLLTFESDWNPPLGDALSRALEADAKDGRLDMGCVAAHGLFGCDASGCFITQPHGKPATAFLLELISRLQSCATVPMIDISAYARWLT